MYTIDLHLLKFYINGGKLYFSIETFISTVFVNNVRFIYIGMYSYRSFPFITVIVYIILWLTTQKAT